MTPALVSLGQPQVNQPGVRSRRHRGPAKCPSVCRPEDQLQLENPGILGRRPEPPGTMDLDLGPEAEHTV